MDPSERLALFGTAEPVADAIPLQAGPLRLALVGTRLLALSAGDHEVWHGVAFLHRDADWGTPEPVIDRIAVVPHAGGFRAEIHAHVPTPEAIALHILVVGDDTGCVRYEGTAVPEGDIVTQRTGLCVMHPMSAMGRAIEVEHDDGRLSRSTFPRLVPAWPPFTSVRAIRHEFADGLWASCRLEGDSFEFEDQRNNADASFKTYNRSNMMPRPYLLRAGVPVHQAVVLRLESAAGAMHGATRSAAPALGLGEVGDRLPPLGLGLAPEDLAEAQRLGPLLRELAPMQLHLVLDGARDPLDVRALAALVAQSGAPLRLDVRQAGSADAALDELAQALQGADIPIEAVAAYPSTPPVIEAAWRAFGTAAIGGGTPYFFAQINRIEDLGALDFLSFTTSSIVHGADDASPMAGLQSLPWLVETARSRHPGVALRIGPSGIAAPRSPLGRQPASDGTRRITLARRDPRSTALYGAAWLLGHVAALAPAGLQGLSVLGLGAGEGLFTTHGHELRPAPAWFVLRELRGAARVRAVQLTHPHAITALCLQHEDGDATLLVGNLGSQTLAVALPGIAPVATHLLDAGSWLEHSAGHATEPWRTADVGAATEAPSLILPAHATARLRLPLRAMRALRALRAATDPP